MWYIEKVWYVDEPNSRLSRQHIFYEKPRQRNRGVAVQLKDTVTGDVAELSSWHSWDNFAEALRICNPYGFVPGELLDGSKVDAVLLVVVDELSVRFLDYIASVKSVGAEDFDIFAHVELLQQQVTVWSNSGTIVEWVAGQYICSLFQMICFIPAGWRGNKFYLRTGPQNNGVGICVEFKDIQKARALVAKAACVGYNPVAEHVAGFFST